MKLDLHKEVALKTALPKHGLKPGDVATLIDFAPTKDNKERGCVLEVFDAVGNSIAVVVVAEKDIEALHKGEVLSVRQLAKAG